MFIAAHVDNAATRGRRTRVLALLDSLAPRILLLLRHHGRRRLGLPSIDDLERHHECALGRRNVGKLDEPKTARALAARILNHDSCGEKTKNVFFFKIQHQT